MLAFANLPQIGRAITSIELFKNPGEIAIFDSLTLIANRYNSLFTDLDGVRLLSNQSFRLLFWH
ncbi:hypothetical protein, partial [Fischerella thermalis]|uniref:hypothetical protein n=1 Tax=Fischerella thermalis TaxID=372787 RepID=UPI00241FF363